MSTPRSATDRWLDGQTERDAFSQWALEEAPAGHATIDLVDFSVLLALARHGRFAAYNYGLDRDSVDRMLDAFLNSLPAEHQVWMETVEAGYEEYLARVQAERNG